MYKQNFVFKRNYRRLFLGHKKALALLLENCRTTTRRNAHCMELALDICANLARECSALLCSAHGALLICKTFFFQQVFFLLETCLRKKVLHGFGRKKGRKPLEDLKGAYKKFSDMVVFLQRTNSAPRFCWENLFQSPRGEIL